MQGTKLSLYGEEISSLSEAWKYSPSVFHKACAVSLNGMMQCKRAHTCAALCIHALTHMFSAAPKSLTEASCLVALSFG